MIRELHVRNLALLEDTRVHLGPGLVALTGPTGAGKSLVLRAIALLFGARFSRDFLRTGADEMELSALVDLAGDDVRRSVAELLDAETTSELVLTRRIDAAGRNRCTANGALVPVGTLRALGAVVAEQHGQSEHHALLDPTQQLLLLDRATGLDALREAYAEQWREHKRMAERVRRLRAGRREREGRIADLRAVIDELDAAELRVGELDELVAEQSLLTQAERHRTALAEAAAALEGDDNESGGAIDTAGRAARRLEDTAALSKAAQEAIQALDGALSLLDEALLSVQAAADSIRDDPTRLEEVGDRIALLRSLLRRHGPDESDAMEALTEHRAELAELLEFGEDASGATARLAQQEAALLSAGRELDLERRRRAGPFCAAVMESLTDLGMAGTRFEVRIADGDVDRATELGLGELEFLIAANVGEDLKSLARSASGGELARLSLAVKGELAGKDSTPVLVFDEVDADVGPRMGEVIGRRLSSLARGHQVLAVTHLPQVAAYADVHLCVAKHASGGRTVSEVEPLSGQARVEEIAEMLHGVDRAAAGHDAASVLLSAADEWRRSGEQSSGRNADGERDGR